MAKQLRCGDLMPGCDRVIEGKDEKEVMAKATEHARNDHNIRTMTPDLEQKVRHRQVGHERRNAERTQHVDDKKSSDGADGPALQAAVGAAQGHAVSLVLRELGSSISDRESDSQRRSSVVVTRATSTMVPWLSTRRSMIWCVGVRRLWIDMRSGNLRTLPCSDQLPPSKRSVRYTRSCQRQSASARSTRAALSACTES